MSFFSFKNYMKGSLLITVYSLIKNEQKKKLAFLTFLIGISILLEMLGIGILLPALSVLLNKNIGEKYHFLVPLLNKLGNPSQEYLVILTMSLIAIVFLLKSIFLVFLSYKQNKFSTELSLDFNNRLFEGYLNQTYYFHLNNNSSILLRNIQNVHQFTQVLQALINLTIEYSLVISIFVFLVIIEPLGTFSVTIFLLITVMLFQNITKKRIINWGISKQKLAGEQNLHLLQGFGGVKEIKIYGKENYFSNEYSKINKLLSSILIRFGIISLLPRIYLELISILGLVTLVIVMVVQGKDVSALISVIGVFSLAAYRLIPSMNRIMSSVQIYRHMKPNVELIHRELIEIEKNDIKNQKSNLTIDFNKIININNLSYVYPNSNKLVLDNINLIINKGDCIGLVGKSGSGKTTLVDLILGLHTPTSGLILIDDFDLTMVVKSWQKLIGYVPQNIYLTDDTIINNIAFGIPNHLIDINKIENVLKDAELSEFIHSLPEGYNTKIGERGSKISGGQRQRIGIARALYNNPDIMIFDEATSALDSYTENNIIETINSLIGQKTIIIITHTTSILNKCNIIYEIKNGKINERLFQNG